MTLELPVVFLVFLRLSSAFYSALSVTLFIRGYKAFPVFHANQVTVGLLCSQGQLSRIWKVQCTFFVLSWAGRDEIWAPLKHLWGRLPTVGCYPVFYQLGPVFWKWAWNYVEVKSIALVLSKVKTIHFVLVILHYSPKNANIECKHSNNKWAGACFSKGLITFWVWRQILKSKPIE